jgi:hypothetical protein
LKLRFSRRKFRLHVFERQFYANQKLEMVLIHAVDVGFALKTAIHHELDLLIGEEVHIGEQILYDLHIRNVSWQLTVVKRQV